MEKLRVGRRYDVQALSFRGWNVPGCEGASSLLALGYNAYDYFDENGMFLGPDVYDIEPLVEDEKKGRL